MSVRRGNIDQMGGQAGASLFDGIEAAQFM